MDNRTNNFDLIRLFGALEVVCGHALFHFGLLDNAPWIVRRLLDLFPGVPIFFVVSGFLITASLERSRDLSGYARNRVLRIYPGLWACFGVTLVVLWSFGALSGQFLRSNFGPWVVAQLTFVQFYNPAALRGFGVGVINGSLWTIPVELGFYVLLPALLFAFGDWRSKRRPVAIAMAVVALFSALLWVMVESHRSTIAKLVEVTPLPHFWMFLLGALAWRYRAVIAPVIRGRFLWWLAAYLALGLTILRPDGPVGVLEKAMLGAVTLSAAFTTPYLAEKLLRGNDISYGVYIYHMLVVNALLQLGYRGDSALLPITIAVTCLLAFASWRLVERPALRRKRSPAGAGRAPDPSTSSVLIEPSPLDPTGSMVALGTPDPR